MAKTFRNSPFRRFGNTMLERQLRKGRGPSFMRLLTVAGRRTGQPHSTPVVPVLNDRGRWLVSPFGEVDWVRNARAVGEVTLTRGDTETLPATELGPEDAVPVLRDYLASPAGRFVKSYFDVRADSPDEAILAEAPRHPVFVLG